MYECPNCREPQPVRRVMKPIWGTWNCASCGALLGVDRARRILAVGCVFGICLFVVFVLERRGLFGGGGSSIIALAALIVGTLVVVAFVDRATLIDRTGMRCATCGYDLQGQTEPRCPECGSAFEPTERAAAESEEASIAKTASRKRTRLVGLMLILGLGALLVLGNLMWYRQARRARIAPPPPPRPAASTNPTVP